MMQRGMQQQLVGSTNSSQLVGWQQAPRSQHWLYRTAGQQHACTPQPLVTSSISTASGRVATHAGQPRQEGSGSHRPDVSVVLVHPQIPQNTGNIARSCAATNVALHLVGPLGFDLTDKKLKRAGLDYWEHVCVKVHDSWEAFFEYVQSVPGQQRLIGYSVYGDTYYAAPEFSYESGDWLLFGAETTGLPLQAHEDIVNSGGCLVKIPIQDTYVRSLNQSVCVGVGLFEALRQLDAGQHVVAPRDDAASPAVRRTTVMQQQQQQQQQQRVQLELSQQQQQQQQTDGSAVPDVALL